MSTQASRARIALAHADKEASDYARGLVGDAATPHRPGELVNNRRRLRLLALTSLDRAVIAEYLSGTTWEQLAAWLGLSVETTLKRYRKTCEEWETEVDPADGDYGDFTVGLRSDSDLEGTAASLDAWYRRHAEPWEPAAAERRERIVASLTALLAERAASVTVEEIMAILDGPQEQGDGPVTKALA